MEIWGSWTAVSAAAVVIYWMRLRYGGRTGKAEEALRGSVDELRAEVDQLYVEMHDRIEATNERIDFAERLLAQRPKPAREEAVNTPV